MAVSQTEIAVGARAPDFRLPATEGPTYALKDVEIGRASCRERV